MQRLSILTVAVALVTLVPAGAIAYDQTDGDVPIPDPNLIYSDDVIVINGTLGSGAPGWPANSGQQVGRLNRNGIASACGAPKVCDIFLTDPGRAYDAYAIRNNCATTTCVQMQLLVLTQENCNLQANAYLGSFDPNNICTNYLADPGLSSGIPPTPVTMSFDVPPGQTLVMVVHTTNPGEIGCDYELTLAGADAWPCDATPVEPATWGVIKSFYND